MKLRFNRRFDRERLIWSRWDSPPPSICSYCAGGLSEVPLMMWDEWSNCIALCDHCVEAYVETIKA